MTSDADLPEPRYEVIAVNLWRRFVLGGEGPELTLAEAAAALGQSEADVRDLITHGRIQARLTEEGEYRITPLARRGGARGIDTRQEIEDLKRLWEELREARVQLAQTQTDRDKLRFELDRAVADLEAARREMADLWQMLRSGPPTPQESVPSILSAAANDPDSAERVRDVVVDYRELLRRRRRSL